jgi:CRISPR-associated protein Csa1
MSPPYSSLKLAVYEVANKYCGTARDLWWRRVMQIKSDPNELMVEGKLLHGVMANVIALAKKLIWTLGIDHPAEIISKLREFDALAFEREWNKNTVKPEFSEVLHRAQLIWDYETSMIEARLREALSRQPYAKEDSIINAAIPIVLEQRLDGSLLGLSKQLSIDAYQSAEPLILELKFAQPADFHKLQVTGYALVAESLFEFPVNLGCIVYASFKGDSLSVEKDFFLIDEELRQAFVEQRDERMRMVIEELDPGLMQECPELCPFFKRCHPERKAVSALV